MKITDIQIGYARFTSAGKVAWKTCTIPRKVIILSLAIMIGIASGTLLYFFLGIPVSVFAVLICYSIAAGLISRMIMAPIWSAFDRARFAR